MASITWVEACGETVEKRKAETVGVLGIAVGTGGAAHGITAKAAITNARACIYLLKRSSHYLSSSGPLKFSAAELLMGKSGWHRPTHKVSTWPPLLIEENDMFRIDRMTGSGMASSQIPRRYTLLYLMKTHQRNPYVLTNAGSIRKASNFGSKIVYPAMLKLKFY